MVFHLLLEEHVIGGGLLQRVSEIARDDDVHHVDLLDIHSVLIEAHVQVILQRRRQFTLDISDLAYLNSSDVVSDRLLTFLGQKLFQLVCTEVVEELLAVIFASLVSANVKSDTDID